MILALVSFILSFIGSFIFAGFETGLVSINSLKVDHAQSEGDKKAGKLSLLLSQQARVVSTVLIGNNIALVIMQWSFAGILLSLFGTVLPIIETALLTIIALIFCELLPKSLFRIYSFKMTHFFSPFIWFLNLIFIPITVIIDWVSNLGQKNVQYDSQLVVSELTAIATEGGRNDELSSMIPLLAKSVLPIRNMDIIDFLENIPLVCKDKLIKTNDLFTFQSNDKAELLLTPEILFSNGYVSFNDESFYSCRSIFEKLVYTKSV